MTLGAEGSAVGVRPRRAPSLKFYVVVLVALIAAAAGANVIYQRGAASDDARESAGADASFAAEIAARDISSAIDVAQTQGASVAASPGIEQVFAAPAGCTLSFGGAGPFATGHPDIVGQDGSVACSSLPATDTAPSGYAGEPWLADALTEATLLGPLVDARTGKQVVLAAAPIAGSGVVVVFLDLELATTLGGPRDLEFVVTNPDDSLVLARSIDSERWVGEPTAGTPFAGGRGQAEHHELRRVRRRGDR